MLNLNQSLITQSEDTKTRNNVEHPATRAGVLIYVLVNLICTSPLAHQILFS